MILKLRLRMWHLIGLVAASACFFAVMQFRRETEDPGYRWIRQLRSWDASKRAEAAGELSQIRPAERKAIAPLTEALFDPDARVRARAAVALRSILDREDDPEAGTVKAALTSALGDRDPDARLAIAGALACFEDDPGIFLPTLLEFARSGDAPKRLEAVNILGIHARTNEAALAAVFAALGDTDPWVRSHSVNALGRCSTDPDLMPEPLLRKIEAAAMDAAHDESPIVRAVGVRTLGGIGGRTKTEFPVVIEALRDPDPDVRLQAATCLAWRRPGASSPGPISELGRSLNDPDKHVRRAAARTLGRLGPDAEATLRDAPADADQDVRQEVAAALAAVEKASIALRSIIREGIANLGDPNPEIRALGADQLARSGPRAAEGIPALVRSLGDPEAEVRRSAALALGSLGAPAAVALPDLARKAESDVDERVRRAAADSRSTLLRLEGGPRP